MKNVAIFDLEIKKPIERCSRGWQSHDEMGVSVLCIYDYDTQRYRFFDENNLREGVELLRSKNFVVGFNSVNFDWKVLRSTLNGQAEFFSGENFTVDYDILREIWVAKGLNPDSFSGAHRGYKLKDVSADTLGITKSGEGALAPQLWEEGRYAELYDYCMQDVKVTKELFEFIVKYGYVLRSGSIIKLTIPEELK